MNLRLAAGRIPIPAGGETPWLFIDWPTREEFDAMYATSTPETREKYWGILQARSQGFLLKQAGDSFGVTRERVRQIEAKFLRLMRARHSERS